MELENSNNQPITSNSEEEKNNNTFSLKKIFFKFGIPVLVFAVSFFILWLLSYKYFYTEFLVADDARDYVHYQQVGFWNYFWLSSRPITYFLMGLGFVMFGHYAPYLMIYVCVFVAGMMAGLYITAKKISKSTIIALFVVVLALFSRLNWYFYATYFGIMESMALICMILSIYFAIDFYQKKNQLRSYIIMCALYIAAAFFHERYMFIFAPIVVLSLLAWDGWKKKLLFAAIPVALFGFFLIYRVFIANATPFVVTGRTSISLDLGTLLSNFWHNFISMFTLRETSPWLVGILNQNLDGLGHALFIITSILSFGVFVAGVILCIYFAKKKINNYLYTGALLALYCAIMLAAGSVSPSRVEPRWTFSGQIAVLLFIGMSIEMMTQYFGRPGLFNEKIKKSNWAIKMCSIFALVVYLSPFVGVSIYAQEHKQQYYISDDIDRTKRYNENIRKAMHEEGKEKLRIITDEYNFYYLSITIPQWEEVKDYEIITLDRVDTTTISASDSFVCICSGDNISRPIDPSYSDVIFENQWLEGKTYSFFANGTIDELYLKLMQTHFQGMPNNMITITNGSEVIASNYEIDANTEFYIPLKKDCVNHITFKAGYTYCPADHGATDTRNLSFYILQLGGIGSEPLTPSLTKPLFSNMWAEGISYSFHVYGTIDFLYLSLMQTHFKDMPNNKITIKNGNDVIVKDYEIDDNMEFLIPLNENCINHIYLISDYTYCPADYGEADTRKLSFFIIQLGGLGSDPLTPSLTEPLLNDYWVEGLSHTFYVNGTVDSLYLKLMQTNFIDMPNNKVTIKCGGVTIVDKVEINENKEFYIPLVKDSINYITLTADYTYCPADHGATDTRKLSLFILQLGGSPN